MATYLDDATATREQRHRRRLLGAAGGLLFLSVSPVFGHHIARGAETLLGDTDHVGQLCLVALHVLLAPVHGIVHLLVFAGLAYAASDRLRAWRRMRRTLGNLESEVPSAGSPVAAAAKRAGVATEAIRVVAGLGNPAFTAGFIRPKIYIAAELACRLDQAQLAAVIAHEGAHVDRRDPLRLSVLRFLAYTLFWLPALRRLAADVADDAEIQADDRAARDRPLVLASALLTVAALGAERSLGGVVAFAGGDLLDRRVRRLAGERTQAGSHVTRRSIAGAIGALLVVWMSGAIMAHPMSAAMHANGHGDEDCTSHPGLAVLHVICDGFPFSAPASDCPHHPIH